MTNHFIDTDEGQSLFWKGWIKLHAALEIEAPEIFKAEEPDRFGLEERELVLKQLTALDEIARNLQYERELQVADEGIDYIAIQKMFLVLETSAPIEIGYGMDFDLELRERSVVISQTIYPALFRFFVAIPGYKGHGLENEHHGVGYHLHYVSRKKGRTNVVYTFHPKEPLTLNSSDRLYWFHHGAGRIKNEPDRFGQRRKKAIHSLSIRFLMKFGKPNFRSPPRKNGGILFP